MAVKSFPQIIAVFAFLCTLNLASSTTRCTSKQVLHIDLQNHETTIQVQIDKQLRKGATYCYALNIQHAKQNFNKNKNGTNLKRTLEVTLKDIWQEFPVIDSYKFSMPNMSVHCECECPWGRNTCDEKHEQLPFHCDESYPQPQKVCFRKYAAGQKATRCFFDDKKAEVCCSAVIYNDKTKLYQAVYLGSESTYIELDINLKTEWNKIIFNEVYSSKQQMATAVANVKIKAQSLNALRSKWVYFDPFKQQIRANTPLNSVDEFDLSKLGWFKVTKTGRVATINAEMAKKSLSIFIQNCVANEFYWHFNAIGFTKEGQKDPNFSGSLLQDIYKQMLNKTTFTDKTVNVYYAPLYPIGFKATLTLPLFSSKARLIDFNATFILDQFGNRFIRISFKNSYGKFNVEVGNSKSLQANFIALVPETESEFTILFCLSSSFTGMQKVCIRDESEVMCRFADYFEEESHGIKERRNKKISPTEKTNFGHSLSENKELQTNFHSVDMLITFVIVFVFLLTLLLLGRIFIWPRIGPPRNNRKKSGVYTVPDGQALKEKVPMLLPQIDKKFDSHKF